MTAEVGVETVVKALFETRRTVQRFRKLANYFSRSTKAKDKLDTIQIQAFNRNTRDSKERSTFTPKRVSTDCLNRWNSTYAMLDRMLFLRTHLEAFLYTQVLLKVQRSFQI